MPIKYIARQRTHLITDGDREGGLLQIITVDHHEFPDLLSAFMSARQVGRYWRSGRAQMVCATPKFLLISIESDQSKIALKPVRSMEEALALATRLLHKEQERGNQVEMLPSAAVE